MDSPSFAFRWSMVITRLVGLEPIEEVVNGGLPVLDARVQAPAWHHQQRKTIASFLVPDSNRSALVIRHRVLPQVLQSSLLAIFAPADRAWSLAHVISAWPTRMARP